MIADIQGRIAAVELGHRVTYVESIQHGTLVRTNHFTGERTAPADAIAAGHTLGIDSRARLAAVEALVENRNGFPLRGEIVSLLSSHDSDHPLCRHGYAADQPKTISLALYDLGRRTLTITDGVPCASPSITYKLERVWQPELAR